MSPAEGAACSLPGGDLKRGRTTQTDPGFRADSRIPRRWRAACTRRDRQWPDPDTPPGGGVTMGEAASREARAEAPTAKDPDSTKDLPIISTHRI